MKITHQGQVYDVLEEGKSYFLGCQTRNGCRETLILPKADVQVATEPPRMPQEARSQLEATLEPPSRPFSSCAHFGPQIGDRECNTCRGLTRLKVYACALHGDTTFQRCRECPDYVEVRKVALDDAEERRGGIVKDRKWTMEDLSR